MRFIHSPHHSLKRPLIVLGIVLLTLTALISFLQQSPPTILTVETAESANNQGSDYWNVHVGPEGSYNEAVHSLLTSDGGLLVSGYSRFFGAGGDDGWLVKLDQNAQIQWQKTYGGGDEEDFFTPIETDDGYIIVVGSTSSFNATNNDDAWILKLNPNGTVVWQKTFGSDGDDRFASVAEASDGGYIVAGSIDPDNDGAREAWLVRLDTNGNLLWEKSFGGPDDDYLGRIIQTSDGGFAVTGTYGRAVSSAGAPWILKLNSDGTINWEYTYDGNALKNISELSDGSFVASGTDVSNERNHDLYVIKIASNGQVIWQKTYGTYVFETSASLQVINDNELMVAGTVINGDYWLLKLDGASNVIWQKIYGDGDGKVFDYLGSLQRAANGDLYMVGYSNYYPGTGKTFIVKVDSDGNTDNCNVGSYNHTIVNLTAPATSANPINKAVNSVINSPPAVIQDSAATSSFVCGGPPTSTINGRITDNNGLALPGAEIGYQSGNVTTDASGYYTITNLLPETYTLIPSLDEYAFTPGNRSVSVPPDQSAQDFMGAPIIYDEFQFMPAHLKQ